MFEYDTIKDKLLNFQKLTVKQRMEWWNSAFKFINKLPSQTKKMQQILRKNNHEKINKN